MKRRLLVSLFMGMCAMASFAQTIVSDVTSKLTNADFTIGDPVTVTIHTYDYDMIDDGAGNGGEELFGMQPVTGWTANFPSDNIKVMQNSGDTNTRTDEANAKAAGLFAYLDSEANLDEQPGLGGAYYAPFFDDIANEDGQCLGMIAVWGASLKYTQDVTLPAGDYMMLVTIYNASGTGELSSNFNGFIAGANTYASTKKTFTAGVWETDTIIFRLGAETAGQVCLGMSYGAGSGSVPHWFIDNVKLYQIASSYIDQKAIDEAKAKLLAAIEMGKTYGVDTYPAETVYDNPNATLEEVLKATEEQLARNEEGLTDLSEAFIVNPHFSEGTPVEGGICTYGKDCTANGVSTDNFSLLPVEGWTPNVMKSDGPAGGVFAIGSDAFLGGTAFKVPNEMSDGSTEGNLLGIVTCWTATAQYTQDVTLPAGSYTVGISYYNAGGANEVAKNLIGFITSGGTEYLGSTKKFPVGTWTSETIKFQLDEETTGKFTLGYTSTNTGSGNMPHLFVDGFSLIYVGSGINASLLGLNATVSGANKLLSEEFNADLRTQLEDAIDAGQDLISAQSTDDDANKKATEAIKALLAEVNANIAAYANLRSFNEKELANALAKYNETEYPELNLALTGILDEVSGALNNLDLTTAEIETLIASLKPTIKEGVQKQWDAVIASGEVLAKDLDISALFDQLAYPFSESAATNPTIENWTKEGDGQFKTQFGTAEIWSGSAVNSFKVSTTIAQLPVGKYTISTKAFFRNADNATNYTNYEETNTPEASLFVGAAKKGLTNVAELASEEPVELWASVNGDDAAPYVPNSQEAAYNIFNDDTYAEMVTTSLSTVVPQNGELTFGITGENMESNCWTVWYTFSVTYNAPTAADVADVLKALKIEAETIQEEVKMVAAADQKIEDAKGAHESVDVNSMEELMAVMAMYEEAIAYAHQADSIYKVLVDRYELYLELMAEVESDEPNYTNMMDEIGENYEEDGGLESNEKMLEYIEAIKNGWAAFVQYPVLNSASLDDPQDISAAIYNNGFIDPATQEQGIGGWTYTRDGGNDIKTGGLSENPSCEFYNNNSFDINQTITGLAEGFYLVRVQGFHRAGTAKVNADSLTADTLYGQFVEFYANTETDNYSVPLKNILQREDEEGVLETGQAATEGETTVAYAGEDEFYIPNTMSSFGEYCEMGIYWNDVKVFLNEGESLCIGLSKNTHVAEDWTIFDNFQLYYLGTEAPDAVESIEAQGTKAPVAIYNLTGQRVAKAIKGLYIINGRTVLVK